jgi:hypothetical protein
MTAPELGHFGMARESSASAPERLLLPVAGSVPNAGLSCRPAIQNKAHSGVLVRVGYCRG